MRDVKISNTLKELGIPTNILGYPYLRYAIGVAMDQPDVCYSLCKQMYPMIARHFASTPTRVERACRHAIEQTYCNLVNQELWNDIFRARSLFKPTNGEFIATVADYLRLEEADDDC